jgi:hypothetical protein
MLRKIGIPVVALLAMFALMAPAPASAAVRFGVGVYAAPPVYSYPAPVYPAYPYPYPGYYSAPYPYAYPSVGLGFGFGYGGGYGYNRGYYGGHSYYGGHGYAGSVGHGFSGGGHAAVGHGGGRR